MTTTAKPLHKCPRREEPHPAHPMRLYFPGMGAVVPTTCPGMGAPAFYARARQRAEDKNE